MLEQARAGTLPGMVRTGVTFAEVCEERRLPMETAEIIPTGSAGCDTPTGACMLSLVSTTTNATVV